MNLAWGNVLMIIVACFFLYLAIAHEFEPLLLVPIAFGMLLVNIYPDIMTPFSEGKAGGLLYYGRGCPVRYLRRLFRRHRPWL